MIWALFEIIIPLLLTFILGLITGWLLWRWRRKRITASEWNTHTDAADAANKNLESFRSKQDALAQENSRMSIMMKKMGGKLDTGKAELENSLARNSELTTELSGANETNRKLIGDIESSGTRVLSLENELQHTQTKVAAFTKLDNESAQLRSDLDTTRTQNTELAAQLRALQATSEDLDHERNRVAELQKQLDDAVAKQKSADDAQTKLEAVNARNVELTSQLKTLEHSQGELQRTEARISELTTKANAADELRAELTQSKSRFNELESNYKQTSAKLATLDTQLKQASDRPSDGEQHRARIADLERQLEACKKRSDSLQQQASQHQAGQNAIVQPIANVQTQASGSSGEVQSLKANIEQRDQKIADLERRLAETRDKAQDRPASGVGNWRDTGHWKKGVTKLGTPGSDHKDDLKVISGIGPEMEKLLNSFEIQSWEQLAALTAEEVEKVDAALTDFPGRIERDEWVLQAQEIMANGHVVPEKRPKKQQPTAKSDDWHSGTTHFGTPGSSHRDDLKEVNGIGPVLEKTLNDFGIQSWEQLAELSTDEVDKIDQAIAFPGRIEREEWVAQAKTLVERFPDRSKRPNTKPR